MIELMKKHQSEFELIIKFIGVQRSKLGNKDANSFISVTYPDVLKKVVSEVLTYYL